MYIKFQDLEKEQQKRLKCYALPLLQTKEVILSILHYAETNSKEIQ